MFPGIDSKTGIEPVKNILLNKHDLPCKSFELGTTLKFERIFVMTW